MGSGGCLGFIMSPLLLPFLFFFYVTKRRVLAVKTPPGRPWGLIQTFANPSNRWDCMGFARGRGASDGYNFSLPSVRGHRPASPGIPSTHGGTGTCCQLTFYHLMKKQETCWLVCFLPFAVKENASPSILGGVLTEGEDSDRNGKQPTWLPLVGPRAGESNTL